MFNLKNCLLCLTFLFGKVASRRVKYLCKGLRLSKARQFNDFLLQNSERSKYKLSDTKCEDQEGQDEESKGPD